MGLWKFLEKLGKPLTEYDEMVQEQKSTYVPEYEGKWVNKGTKDNENWVWEKTVIPLRPSWVNVYESKGLYTIAISNYPSEDSIDTTECEDDYQAKKLMECLEKYYQYQGKVRLVYDKEYL